MRRNLSLWQVGGFLFTSAFGTFLHFLFDLSGQSILVGLFSAVNESIWEHMKLIYYPMLLFSILEHRFWRKELPRFWCVKLAGTLLALGLIPVLYYSYTGILGFSIDPVNIAIFFLAAGAAYWMETWLFRRKATCSLLSGIALGILCLIGILFTLFTFFPPTLPLFRDPLTGNYGLWER